MLIDDDYDFVQINRHILSREGYRIDCHYDAADALAALATATPDLVITDLMMKSLDAGFALARKIKADPRLAGVPIIIATSVTSQLGMDFHARTPADLAAMGVDAYFDKPIPPKALLEKVKELLAR
jgi:chemosensory pili system protein ChpA (sensor histidine kinase/response regulator)